jgi:hypothetical protein
MNTITTIKASKIHDSHQAHLLSTSRLGNKVYVAVKDNLKISTYIDDKTHKPHHDIRSASLLSKQKVSVSAKHSSRYLYIYSKTHEPYHANSSASPIPIQKYMYPPNTLLPHLQAQRSRNRRSKHTHHTHTHRRRRTRMLRRTNA